MEYEQFINDLKKELEFKLTDKIIKVNKVIKNNSLELDGISILSNDNSLAPTIYANEYYDMFIEGTCMEEIIDKILEIYKNSEINIDEEVELLNINFENMQDSITYQIVNYGKNKKLFKQFVYYKFLDLAYIFYWVVKIKDDKFAMVRITNEDFKKMNITKRKLLNISKINTERLFPPKIDNMRGIIKKIFESDLKLFMNEQEFEMFYKEVLSNEINTKSAEMFVISNNSGVNGASVMMYKNFLKNFANKIQKNLYILPSSIHEIIILPCNNNFNIDFLSEIVCDVNRTKVPIDEILSDKVYYFDRKKDIIQIA